MKQLTNRYTDCQLVNLEPETPKGPYLVAQEGYDPADSTMQMAMYFLKRDGTWIHEISNASIRDGREFDVVFDDVQDVINLLGSLTGSPVIEPHELTAADVQAHIARLKSSTIAERTHAFIARYRQGRPQ